MINQIPKMLMGDELRAKLTHLPEYDESIRKADAATRLMTLSDIYQIYIPSNMSVEIYSKMYLAMIRSIQKKTLPEAVRQRNETYKNYIQGQKYTNGIIGGSDSFTIIGCSGIGKSSAIFSAMRTMGADKILENDSPFMKVIPVLNIQCPFDCSCKSLLLNILQLVDERLGSNYSKGSIKSNATTDALITTVSQCCLNHIGLLVVDEIQNVVLRKNGSNLIGCLTQLINSSGISIAMVGTPPVTEYFNKEMQMARRSLGLQYSALAYDGFFDEFCKTVFSYQYVKEKTEFSHGISEWLYEHSGGIISVVISLIHDAQEIAILSGRESLDFNSLNLAYDERMKMLHGYLEGSIVRNRNNTKMPNKQHKDVISLSAESKTLVPSNFNVYDFLMEWKDEREKAIEVLQNRISVTELQIGGRK